MAPLKLVDSDSDPPRRVDQADTAAGLTISLLGDLRVSRDGLDLPLPPSRKARALLAFLVLTGRPHRRERLCELFWDIPDDPKGSLRWALSKLRKVVDDADRPRLLTDRERVSLSTDDIVVDLHRYREALSGQPADAPIEVLAEAAERLSDPLLGGLDDAGEEAFASWLVAQREEARADHVEALRYIVAHPDLSGAASAKWTRLLGDADPEWSPETLPKAREVPPATPQAGLRFQRIGFCEAPDGTTIAHARTGSGPPLLKAANWLTHIEHDWNSPIWGACFAELARDRTFYRYDERGCGLSDWDVGDLDFESFVEDLEVVADRLGLERFPLLGISQGAAVGIEYAVRHPERVSGLILIGAYASGWRHHASAEEQARRVAVRNLTELSWGTDNPAYRHIFTRTFMPDAAPDELAWFDEFQRLTTSAANAARFQDAFGDIDVRNRLAHVQAPTIVLHATGDQRIPLAEGRKIAAAIPDATFVPLESRNHVLVDYEPAWRTCMDRIREFLETHRI